MHHEEHEGHEGGRRRNTLFVLSSGVLRVLRDGKVLDLRHWLSPRSMKFRNLTRIDREVFINPMGDCRLPVIPRSKRLIPRL